MAKRLTIKGIKAVAKALKNFEKRSVVGTKRGLKVWGEETLTAAKKETPVAEGTLRGSGDVEEKDVGGSLAIEISFGGDSPAGAYAIPVHERPARHSVGGDKYLERPALDRASRLIPTIGQEVRRETGMK